MSQVNYKQKYEELKFKFLDAVDQAFRLGFEQGNMQAQQDQVAQYQQQQQELNNAMQGNAPAQDNKNPEAQNPYMSQDSGSELDQHIAQLEQMIGKQDKPEEKEEMSKALNAIKSFRKEQLEAIDLKKSSEAISGISKALHKNSFKLGKQASHNMTDSAKRAVGMQHKIVEDIMKSWEAEEASATKDIKNVLSVEGLNKKE